MRLPEAFSIAMPGPRFSTASATLALLQFFPVSSAVHQDLRFMFDASLCMRAHLSCLTLICIFFFCDSLFLLVRVALRRSCWSLACLVVGAPELVLSCEGSPSLSGG